MLAEINDVCRIKEQVIEDKLTGLTLTFKLTASGECRVYVDGECLPNGHRVFEFDTDGTLAGRGSFAGQRPRLHSI